VSWDKIQSEPQLQDIFLRDFDQMTPENEMKWDSVQPGLFTYDFTVPDAMVNWAMDHGKRVRGHTLVWGNQNPSWITDVPWTRETLLALMKDHITTVMQHFSGRVREWDVLNEAIDLSGNYTDNVWHRVIGPDYIDYAFRFARKADPTARLYYNDTGLDLSDHPHTMSVLRMLEGLRDRGVPVDGVGLQAHVAITAKASEPQLTETMHRFTALGLDVAVTEMDVIQDGPGTPAQRLDQQREIFGDYAHACRMEPRCTSFTTWGISDKYSWYADQHPEWKPLMFDDDFNPKPALSAVNDWIRRP
jgi:endo-1,4-beta-xylanase